MEFWNADLTQESWNALVGLRKEIDFILIGGWAIYLYTKLQKSKDIDIIVDYRTLRILKSEYSLSRNDRLMKYEVKSGAFDIDVYLPKYSKLTIPPEEIISKYINVIDGFKVPTPEALIILKLGAFSERSGSIKGEKDVVDILGMLFYAGVDASKLEKLLGKYGTEGYTKLLTSALVGVDRRVLGYLGLNEKDFSRLRRDWLRKLKELS